MLTPQQIGQIAEHIKVAMELHPIEPFEKDLFASKHQIILWKVGKNA